LKLTGQRTFVGFGFGAIQAGLFLYEAFRSDNFGRLVVAEVVPDVLHAVRDAGGRFSLNIAHSDHIEVAEVGPLEIQDPGSESDRRRLVEAVAEAEEIATAVPSVQFYTSPDPGSIHRLLAEGLRRKAAAPGPQAIVYAAENHNHAAEILQARVLEEIPEEERERVCSRVRFLNTVIGKMSGVVSDADEIRLQGLATITPGGRRSFLVEAFNRILISRIRFAGVGEAPPFQRGIKVFEEKDDLLPFEEAKLYGHNATHALAAYVGTIRGLERIADLSQHPDIFAFLRAAFIQESGEALARKHAGKDPLFTHEGYREYADDLLARMVNPFLHDSAERVGRDPQRKLEWGDRLPAWLIPSFTTARKGLGATRSENWSGATAWWEPCAWRYTRAFSHLVMPSVRQPHLPCWIVTPWKQISRWQHGSTRSGRPPRPIRRKEKRSST